MMKCREALQQTNGDIVEAIKWLRKKEYASLEKKMHRETKEGLIGSYVHHDLRTATLVELACETDFVARNEKFIKLANDLANHLALNSDTRFVYESEITPEIVRQQAEQLLRQQSPAERGAPGTLLNLSSLSEEEQTNLQDQALQHLRPLVLTSQQFSGATDEEEVVSVDEHLRNHMILFGEVIRVKRFCCFKVGSDKSSEASAAGEQAE